MSILKNVTGFERVVANAVKPCVEGGRMFHLRKICEECGLDFDDRKDYAKIYSVIVKWREMSLEGFDEVNIDEWLKEHGSRARLWDEYLKMLNAKGIYVLFAIREKEKSRYYQPSWLDKELVDFFRWKRQVYGQLTILTEMDRYGEEFPEEKGIRMSPKEIAIELMGTLDKAQLELDERVENKIKELMPPKE